MTLALVTTMRTFQRGLVLLGSLLCSSLLCGCQTEPGKLTVDPPDAAISLADTDESPSGSRVVFTLTNTGGKPLEITDVKTTCGCTVAQDLAESQLQPGESVQLHLEATPPAYGDKDVRISILTDSAATPQVDRMLHLSGAQFPVPRIQFHTDRLTLNGAMAGEPLTGLVRIDTHETPDQPRWVTGLTTTHPDVTITPLGDVSELRLTHKAVARSYQFEVTGLCPASDPLATFLTIETSSPSHRGAERLPLSIERSPALRVLPDVVLFRRDAEDAVRMVVVVSDDRTSFEVGVEHSPKWCSIRTLDEGAQSVQKLECSYSELAGEAAESEDSAILLSTTHPLAPSLRIPIEFVE
jgi:hypothetical protein